MLEPDEIEKITDRITDLASYWHKYTLIKLVRRLMARFKRGNETVLSRFDAYQMKVLQDAGVLRKDLEKELSQITGKGADEIKKAFTDACDASDKADAKVYERAGISITPLEQSPALVRKISQDMASTQNTFYNLTHTTADAVQTAFINACDNAYNKANSGLVTLQEAVAEEVESLANSGIKFVSYTKTAENGKQSVHRDTIETATLRAVRTGITQCTGGISLKRLEENEWDIVLVSAHLGARDKGTGPENHAEWQGKFYSLNGKSDFPDFYKATGYGTGEGLCGWNCRHSFGAGDGVFNPYSKMDFSKNHEIYEKSQEQRKMERAIRKQKDKIDVYDQAIKEDDTNKPLKDRRAEAQDELVQMNKAYIDWCKDNGVKQQEYRLRTAKPKKNIIPITAEKTIIAKSEISTDTVQSLPAEMEDLRNKWGIEKVENAKDITLETYISGLGKESSVGQAENIVINGVITEIDGKKVYFDYKPEELLIGTKLAEFFGGELLMRPVAPGICKVSDYLLNDVPYDLKAITGESKHAFYNATHDKKDQAERFVFDISNAKQSKEEIIFSINEVLSNNHTQHVKQIVLIDKGIIFAVFER